MKFYITKNVLRNGKIEELDESHIKINQYDPIPIKFSTMSKAHRVLDFTRLLPIPGAIRGTRKGSLYPTENRLWDNEWTTSKDEAIRIAKDMVTHQISYYQRKIATLEGYLNDLTFESIYPMPDQPPCPQDNESSVDPTPVKVLSFECESDLSAYSNSMLVDSGTVIASLDYEDHGVRVNMDLIVHGNVHVCYQGKSFRIPSKFPAELAEMIRSDPNWMNNALVFVVENNWFEFIYTVDDLSNFDGELCEENLADMTSEQLKAKMVQLCERIITRHTKRK